MLLVSKIYAAAQKVPEDFGFRHIKLSYLNDPVDVIIISKQGEERIPKPIFLFCQDSFPKPVIKYSEKGLYEILPFDYEILLDDFHIVIVGKPFIPIICNSNKLDKDFLFLKDFEKQIPPRGYADRNYLDYYVFRNNAVLKQLFKYRWAKTSKLLVAGQGEGSSIAVKMATINKKITHLIYLDGNPYGALATELEVLKLAGNSEQSTKNVLNKYREVVATSTEIQYDQLETSKAIFSFSLPQRNNLMLLKIPVLICYGSHDSQSTFNQLFQMEAIREGKQGIQFCDFNRNQVIVENSCGESLPIEWQHWWKQS